MFFYNQLLKYQRHSYKDFTYIHIAAYYGYSEALKYFLHKEMSLNTYAEVHLKKTSISTSGIKGDKKCISGNPIHIAAMKGNKEIIELLLNKGVDINEKDEHGLTPLHCASSNDHLDVVAYLISKGGDTSVKDNKEMTPLDYAVQKGNDRIVKYLESVDKNTYETPK